MTNVHITTEDPSTTPLDANGFVGVSPEYQNFANDTDKPLEGKEDEVKEDKAKEGEAKEDDKKVEPAKESTPAKSPTATPAK